MLRQNQFNRIGLGRDQPHFRRQRDQLEVPEEREEAQLVELADKEDAPHGLHQEVLRV